MKSPIMATALILAAATVPHGIAFARSATAAAPATRALYLNLIQQARVDGRSRAALAYLDDYDKTYPADVEAGVLRINCLLDLRDIDGAEALLKQLRPPNHPGGMAAQVNAVHGHVLAARGRWGDAVPFYTAAVAADPTSFWMRNALGYSLLRDGQMDRAVDALRDARDLAPDNEMIRNNLFLAYALSGRMALLDHALGSLPDLQAGTALRQKIDAEVVRLRPTVVGTLASLPVSSGSTPAKKTY